MPNFSHGKTTQVFDGAYNLSPFLNSVDDSNKTDKAETTTFVAPGTDPNKTYLAGFKDGSVKFAGFWDGTALSDSSGTNPQSGIEAILAAAIGTQDKPVSWSRGSTAIGNRAVMIAGNHSDYSVSSKHNAAVAVTGEAQADGGLHYGVWLHPLQAETVTINMASVDNGAATTTGYFAVLHVVAVGVATAPTLNVIIQDSADNVTFADLINFTPGVSGITSQYLIGAPGVTVRRYTRAKIQIGGTGGPSFTFVTALSRV